MHREAGLLLEPYDETSNRSELVLLDAETIQTVWAIEAPRGISATFSPAGALYLNDGPRILEM